MEQNKKHIQEAVNSLGSILLCRDDTLLVPEELSHNREAARANALWLARMNKRFTTFKQAPSYIELDETLSDILQRAHEKTERLMRTACETYRNTFTK